MATRADMTAAGLTDGGHVRQVEEWLAAQGITRDWVASRYDWTIYRLEDCAVAVSVGGWDYLVDDCDGCWEGAGHTDECAEATYAAALVAEHPASRYSQRVIEDVREAVREWLEADATDGYGDSTEAIAAADIMQAGVDDWTAPVGCPDSAYRQMCEYELRGIIAAEVRS